MMFIFGLGLMDHFSSYFILLIKGGVMTRKIIKSSILVGCALFVFAFQSTGGSEEKLHRVWAVKDCKIVTLAGPQVEKGTIVVRNGLIEAAGANILIPPDAEVLDGAKLTLCPGLIDGLGQSLLKFPEEKFEPSKIYSGEFTDKDKGITPEIKAYDYINLGKSIIEKYHKFGITAAQVIPEKGIFPGQSSFFSLGNPDKNKALLLKDNCLGLGFSPANFMVYPNSLMGVVAYLKQAFTDASYFEMNRDRWQKEMKGIQRPDYTPQLEILTDYTSGKKPVIFLCNNQNDIRRALNLAAEYKLNYLICDLGSEAWRVIPELKNAKARVLCTVSFKVPPTSIHSQLGKDEKEKAEKEIYPKNPTKLAEAGIPFAFSSLGTDDPKSFMEGVQKAIDAGLPREKALEALTTTTASFFGLERALGTIEPGKIANFVLAEGDLLTKEAKTRYVFADGEKFELKEAKAKEGEKPTVNVSGKWEISAAEGLKFTVEFTQEEASLSGRMTTPFGVFDFTGGTVSGNEIYFEMTLSVGGQEIDLYFSATVTGDTMRGTVVQGTYGSSEFTGKRIP
jgi:hypothetical protein